MSSFARHIHRLAAFAALGLGLIIASIGPASAARHALVIGNDAYASVRPLVNAVNDAEAIATALETVGYNVIVGRNANRLEMSQLLSRLTKSLEPGDEVVFYYAGHGVELRGRNLLLPVDFPPLESSDELVVESASIELDFVLRVLNDSKARVRIVILDACRDNPLGAENGRSVGSARGLAPVAPVEGTVVMYSAGAGQKALDTDGSANSIFASSLIPLIQTRGLSLIDLARQVRRDVETAALKANHEQRPAYYEDVTDDYYFVGGPEDQPVIQPPVVVANTGNTNANQGSGGGSNSTAVACDESGSLFYDDFTSPDASWGNPGDGVRFDGGKMLVTAQANKGYSTRNRSGPFEEFEVCVDFVLDVGGTTALGAAILFWGVDRDNYYVFDVKPDGRFMVARFQDATWIVPVPITQTRNVMKPAGEPNRLRVVARGNVAAAYINDRLVTQFRGFPPEGGGTVGLRAAAPEANAATVEYDNFVVSTANLDTAALSDWGSPVRQGASLDCQGSTERYHDDFSVADPAWGNGQGKSVADGMFTVALTTTEGVFNRASLYKGDIELCLDVAQHHNDPQTASAGIAFWGENSDNYYTFTVTTNGNYGILRLKDNTWEYPVNWTKVENLILSGTGNNRLRLVIRGNTVTGYVNGQQVTEVTIEPPEKGTFVGVFADAPRPALATFDYDNFTVTN